MHLARIEHWLGVHGTSTQPVTLPEEVLIPMPLLVNAVTQDDTYRSALQYFVIGTRILRKKKQLTEHEKKLLTDSRLEMSGLLCDWSVSDIVEVSQATNNMWKTAWSEYHLSLLEWPDLNNRYGNEVSKVMSDRMKMYKLAKNVGMVLHALLYATDYPFFHLKLIATALKIESLRSYDSFQKLDGLKKLQMIWGVSADLLSPEDFEYLKRLLRRGKYHM